MNIEEDPTLIDFLDSRDIKKQTKETYIKRIQQYCQFTDKTPSQLIEEAENEEENIIRMRNRKIRRYLIDFMKYMKQDHSPNYIRSTLTTIRSFYSGMEIELPNISCNAKEQEQLVTINDIPTKEHIRRALKYSNIKYRAIILLMMSSGMGSAEIRHLTLKDYLDSLKIKKYNISDGYELTSKLKEKEKEIPIWSIRRYKTKMPYVTFSSPESIEAINNYIDERYEKKYPFKSVDDCLFENKGKHIGRKVLISYFARLNDTCGFGFFKRQRFFRAHSLRKYFATTIKNNGMDHLTSEWMIGHKINSVTDAYIKPDIYRMKKDYIDVLPYLSLESIEVTTVESDAVKEIKKSFEKKLAERDEQTKPLLWLAEVVKADPELAELVKKSALKNKK